MSRLAGLPIRRYQIAIYAMSGTAAGLAAMVMAANRPDDQVHGRGTETSEYATPASGNLAGAVGADLSGTGADHDALLALGEQ